MAAPSLTAISVYNGFAPSDTPKVLTWDIDFSSVSTQAIDLFQQNTNGQLEFVQTAYIDNTRNPNAVVLTISVTQQRIVVPGGAGQIIPVFSTDQTQITAVSSATTGARCLVELLNIMLPAMTWGVVAPGAQAALASGTDKSGTITAGGTAQAMAAANPLRQSLTGQNISAGDLWFNEMGNPAVIGAAGSYKVASGQSFAVATNRAISIIGATTGQAWTATET